MRINEEKELCMGIKGKLKNKKNTFYFEVTVSKVSFFLYYLRPCYYFHFIQSNSSLLIRFKNGSKWRGQRCRAEPLPGLA